MPATGTYPASLIRELSLLWQLRSGSGHRPNARYGDLPCLP